MTHQEFPYDIGIYSNICQGMGFSFPLTWLNPLASTPSLESGLSFETNGFEDEDKVWPPPDPDRSYKRHVQAKGEGAFVFENEGGSGQDTMEAFRKRQEADEVRRRRPFVERVAEIQGYEDEGSGEEDEKVKYGDGEGEEGWRNSEGERLQDFGVDEDVEFYDEEEDEIPLAELIARKQAASNAAAYS
jgi:palmitoyltransferase